MDGCEHDGGVNSGHDLYKDMKDMVNKGGIGGNGLISPERIRYRISTRKGIDFHKYIKGGKINDPDILYHLS